MNKMKRLFMLVTAVIQIGTGSPTCNSNQKMRHDRIGNNICCYTVTCTQGQKFAFCDNDQGHDTCTNCPENSYHLDTIDTSIMTSELDPCIPKPTCEQPEVKLENGKCVCDRGRGYFGSDFNNCMLAEMVCSSPGFELRDNGKCEPCDEDFFKPEASAEHICRRKSHCHESQEIANDGSSTVDRSCKARTLRNLSPVKPTTEHHDSNKTIPMDKENCSSVLLNITKQLKNLQKEVKKFNRRNTLIHEKLRALRRKTKRKTENRRKKIVMHKRKQKKTTITTVSMENENCSSVILDITKQLKNLHKEVKKLNRRNTKIHNHLKAMRRKTKRNTGKRRKKNLKRKRKQKKTAVIRDFL